MGLWQPHREMPLVKAFFHNLPAEQCLHSAPHGQVNKKSKPQGMVA